MILNVASTVHPEHLIRHCPGYYVRDGSHSVTPLNVNHPVEAWFNTRNARSTSNFPKGAWIGLLVHLWLDDDWILGLYSKQ